MSMSIPCCMQPCSLFFPAWMWQEQKLGMLLLLLLPLPLPRQQICVHVCLYVCVRWYIKIAVEAATTPAEAATPAAETEAQAQPKAEAVVGETQRDGGAVEGGTTGTAGTMCAACAPRKYIFQHEAWAWDIEWRHWRRSRGVHLMEGLNEQKALSIKSQEGASYTYLIVF